MTSGSSTPSTLQKRSSAKSSKDKDKGEEKDKESSKESSREGSKVSTRAASMSSGSRLNKISSRCKYYYVDLILIV